MANSELVLNDVLCFLAAALRALRAMLLVKNSRRYLSYSEANFEVFRPAGATRCTDGGEIFGPLLRAKLHTHRCNDKGIGLPN